MATWMKKIITAEGVTEYQPGSHLAKLSERFGGSGAVMLLLDVSGSMSLSADSKARASTSSDASRLTLSVEGCSGFIDEAVSGGYEVGLILWNHEIVGLQAPTKEGVEARELLKAAQATGGSQLSPALERAGEVLNNLDVSDRVIAVFTDGQLGSDEANARRISAALAAKDIRILTLGLGQESAKSLASISTEDSSRSNTTTGETMSADIRGMARGLVRRKR